MLLFAVAGGAGRQVCNPPTHEFTGEPRRKASGRYRVAFHQASQPVELCVVARRRCPDHQALQQVNLGDVALLLPRLSAHVRLPTSPQQCP